MVSQHGEAASANQLAPLASLPPALNCSSVLPTRLSMHHNIGGRSRIMQRAFHVASKPCARPVNNYTWRSSYWPILVGTVQRYLLELLSANRPIEAMSRLLGRIKSLTRT